MVVSTLLAAGYEVTCVLDDDPGKWGRLLLGIPVVGGLAELDRVSTGLAVIGVGDNRARRLLAHRLTEVGWATVIHPSAFVHGSVTLGPGTVVFAGAVVQPETVVGAHVVVNTRASIDHDCRVADFVHVAPGTSLCGGVSVSEGALLGVGSSVIPCRKVGRWATVGAGSVVVKDVPDEVTVVGVPARPVRGGLGQ